MVVLTKLEKSQKEEKAKGFKPLLDELSNCSDEEFVRKLMGIMEWDRSRDDLFVWVQVLNRIDGLLQNIVDYYSYKTDNWKKNPTKLVEMNDKDEHMVSELLFFTCRLLNNTCNRSIYSSLDVMNNLLNCPNFKIKLGAMKVIATMGERYVAARHRIDYKNILSSQELKKKALNLALCLSSSVCDDNLDHLSLSDLFYDKKKYPSKWRELEYCYYVTSKKYVANNISQPPPKRVNNATSSIKRFKLSTEELKTLSLQQIYDKGMEEIPPDRWFDFSLHACLAKSFSQDTPENIHLRHIIIQTKFNSIAFVNTVYSPAQVSSKLFEVDPYAFNGLTEFISLLEKKIPRSLRIDALFTLECISLKHIWCSDIVRSIGGNMSHGLLFQILRYIGKITREGNEDEIDEEYNVRFFYLISNLVDVKSLQESLISAGLIPSLLEIISIKNSKYKRTMASATHLLEVIISDMEATNEFITNDGFNVLIESINSEVNFALDHPESGTTPKYSVVYYTISFRQLGYIRSLLKLVLKLLKTDSGDRIRNLIDSPILHSLKKILENRPIFGFTLLTYSLDVVQTIINTEPTIYQVLVESDIIPYIINNFDNFLGPSGELLCLLPEVVSALCLNIDGLKQIQEKNLIKFLFDILLNPEYTKIMSWEDNAIDFGGSIDELARHYPDLKPKIEQYFVETIKQIPRITNFNYTILYKSSEGNGDFYRSKNEPVIDYETNSSEITFWELQKSAPIIDCFSGVLYGMTVEKVSWASLADKINPDDLLRVIIPEVPTFDYIRSQTLLNFTDALKMFDDERRDYLLPFLLKILSEKLNDARELLNYDFEMSYILTESDEMIEDCLRKLSIINVILFIITDIYINITSLFPVRVIQIMEYFEKNGFEMIHNLCLLFQRSALEELYIRKHLPESVSEETLGSTLHTTPPIIVHALKPLKGESKEDKTSAKFKNTLQTRHLFHKLQSWCSMMLRCFLRLTHTRKMNVESSDRALELRIFDKIITEVIKLMNLKYLDTHLSYFLVIFNFNTFIFTYPNITTSSGGTIQTIPALLFYQAGGYKLYHEAVKLLFEKVLKIQNIEEVENIDYVKDQDDVLTVTSLINALSFMNKSIQVDLMENIRNTKDYYPFDEVYYNITRALVVPIKILALHSLSDIFELNGIFDTNSRRIPYSVFKQVLSMIKGIYKTDLEIDEDDLRLYELQWDLIPPSYRKIEMLTACGISSEIARGYLEEQNDELPITLKPDIFTDEEWSNYQVQRKSNNWVTDLQFLPPQFEDYSTKCDLSKMRTDFYQNGFEKGILTMLQHYPKLINAISHMFLQVYEELGFPHTSMLEDLQEMINNIPVNDSSKLAPAIHLFGIFLNDKKIYDQSKKEIFKFVTYLSKSLHPQYVNDSWFSKALYVYEIIFAKSQAPEVESFTTNKRVPYIPIYNVYRVPQREKQAIFDVLIRTREITDFYSALAISRILILYTKDENYAQEVSNSGVFFNLLKVIGLHQKYEKINYLESSFLLLARRCFENNEIISNLVRYELSKAFTTRSIGDHKEKSRDLPGLVSEKANLVMRSPELFINCISEMSVLEDFSSPSELKSLNIKRQIKENNETVKEHKIEEEKISLTNQSGIVHLILSQLMASYKKDWTSEPPSTEESHTKKRKREDVKASKNSVCAYMIFLLKVLIELLSSYKKSKLEFLTFNKRNAYAESPKPRTTALNFFLYQLLDFNTHDHDKFETKRREVIARLSRDVIIGFVSSVHDKEQTQQDFKCVDVDMTFIRKFTIESISKALKDCNTSPKLLDSNVGRLYGLFHLASSLLVIDKGYLFSVLDSNKIESDKYQLCKLMLEMNIPGTITECMSLLDLNHPFTKKLFNSSVEPLNAINEVRTHFSDLFKVENNEDEEDVDDDSEKDDIPDMFKNSALGMYDIEDIEEDDDGVSLIGDDEDIAFVAEDEDGIEVVFSEDEHRNNENMQSDSEDNVDMSSQSNSDSERSTDSTSYEIESENIGLTILNESVNDESSSEGDERLNSQEEETYYSDNGESIAIVELDEGDFDSELDIDLNDSELDSSDWESGLSELSNSEEDISDERQNHHEAQGNSRWFTSDGVQIEDESDPEDRGIFTGIQHVLSSDQHFFRVDDGLLSQYGARSRSQRRHRLTMLPPSISLLTGTRHGQSILMNPLGPSGLEEIENRIVPQQLGNFENTDNFRNEEGFHLSDVLFDSSFFDEKSFEGILLKSTTARWNDIFEMFYDSKIYTSNVIPSIVSRIFSNSSELYVKKQEEKAEKIKQDEIKRGKDMKDRVGSKKRKLKEIQSDDDESEGEDRNQENNEHEPVYVDIEGEQVDIGGTDIDPEFLSALPEEMRGEVFVQYMRERRASESHQQFNSRETDSTFLNSIPEVIREEILATEPTTRIQRFSHGNEDENDSYATEIQVGSNEISKKKSEKLHFPPLVDRSGIAAIMKAVFISQPYLGREIYHELFHRLCLSKQNRSDVMNMLLLILTEGINDQHSLEKVYNLIANRATSNNIKMNNRQLPPDCTPLTVANQSIEILQNLIETDNRIRFFFITEHENLLINKTPLKNKKDASKTLKWPINCLLLLLGKKIILDEIVLMDLLTRILQICSKSIESIARTSKDNHKKKFEIPQIEIKYLELIVSIIKLDSCNTKVFQQTLNTMTNLFVVKDALEIFTKELSILAVDTIDPLVRDLDLLTMQIPKVTNGTEIDSDIIQRFTVPSSEQSKLLKVVTAIDYIYSNKKKDNEIDVVKLMDLYNKMELGKVWVSLSKCLETFEEKRGDISTSATILLPLIESLMVVCKHSKVRETKESALKYESKKCNFAEIPVENLFFSFTDLHKKLLNKMIRSNPKLMSGPFSLLVKNPKMLDFDNKRYFFVAQIRSDTQDRTKMVITVRRDQVFLDSYRSLFFKSNDEIKNSKLEIVFKGEAGVDAGGITREWYQVLSRQMFNPDYALFLPVASDKTTFHPNRTSGINPEHLSFFKFIGMIIGKAISNQCFLDCHFSREVYKNILGKPVSLKEMESLDLDYYKSLIWILENNIVGVIEETFSVETDDYGEHKIVDLIENGRNIPVTESNKQEYVKKIVEYKLQTSVKDQMDNFLQGFYAIIPRDLISIFDEQELELLISGLPDIDVDDWKNNTTYVNYTPTCKQINYFWRTVRSFDKEERAKLLQFVTGTSKVPLNGFKELSGVNGISRFSIHKDYGSTDRLPSSHTCFNQLDLPAYTSYETLRGSLLLAINEGHEGFGIA